MNTVYIMDITPLMNKEIYGYYYKRVHRQRQIKADNLKSDTDKSLCIGVGVILRYAIENNTPYKYSDLSFDIHKNGKPYVKDNPFYFSLSHSGKYAVCAISNTPVGVDIEFDKPLPIRIRKRFADNVLEWTEKEAKGKVTGNGFFDKSNDEYVYTSKKTDGYIITVCSTKKFDKFIEYDLPFPC